MSTHIKRPRWFSVVVFAVAVCAAGCFDDNTLPQGLHPADAAAGPKVVFDLDTRPFPDIPFPNDLATVADATSPTGRRVNVSLQGATDAEARVRRYVDRLTGFGVYTPITVSFDAPLDVEHIIERHQESTPDLSDDVVYLVNVDPDSDEFGAIELLDMGRGNFPKTLKDPDKYFRNDPRSAGTNLLFETVAEQDTNQNGQLDPIEDTDDDGVWDHPNTLHAGADPYDPDEFLDFYERETNTLMLRALDPLQAQTTYAVVLTSELVGEDGEPVQSPFETVNHTRQSAALDPLRQILSDRFPERFSTTLDHVRFAWTFTTGSPTRELQAVRAGLYGHGSLKWLAHDYPATLELLHNPGGPDDDRPLTFKLDPIIPLLAPVASQAIGSGGDTRTVEDAIGQIDYLVSGSFLSPYFLTDSDGLASPGADATLKGTNPQDDDEVFDIDVATGSARVRPGEVTFHCAVPKEDTDRKPPYPVIIYSHAIGSTRLEMIAFAGHMAKFGLATCTIDAAGHGLDLPDGIGSLLDQVAADKGLPLLRQMLAHDRARDLDNDGAVETGEDYFISDILHARDMIRQTTIDQMQLVRILRSFGGSTRWPDEVGDDRWIADKGELVAGWDQNGDGQPEIRGDFNGDGTVDLGGEQAYVAWGTSLGGLQTGVLAGIEPAIRAAATNAGGAGLGDIAARTGIGNVRNGVFLPLFGPLLVGNAPTDDQGNITGPMRLSWLLPSGIDDKSVAFGQLDNIENGDRIVLRNPRREARSFIPADERQSSVVVRDGRFRVGIAADADVTTARRAKLGLDPSISLRQDIMGCVGGQDCGDDECEDNQFCDADQTCQPLSACVPGFEPDDAAAEFAQNLPAHTISTPTDFGDPLIIEVHRPDGTLERTIDRFEQNVVFENILYPAGAPLAALHTGWGLKRQTPRLRKFLGISQMLLEAADPAVYADHYFEDPLTFDYETPEFQTGTTNMLVVATLGDQTVPVNTGISLARAAGIVDPFEPVDEYGTTENQFLVDHYVYEGIARLDRFPAYPNTLFDPDDLDRGQFISSRQSDNPDPNLDAETPLRATVETSSGVSALRMPYLDTHGEHTFNVPRTDWGFHIATFMANQVGWYLANYGQTLSDDPCQQTLSMPDCGFFDPATFTPPSPK